MCIFVLTKMHQTQNRSSVLNARLEIANDLGIIRRKNSEKEAKNAPDRARAH